MKQEQLPSNLVPQVMILDVWDEKMQDLTLVNYVILIFKRYIYLKRKDGLNFYGLKAYIKSIENIERHIASQRQKFDYHQMEQVNCCIIKYTRVLSMLGNCFPDWGGVGVLGGGCLVRDLSFYIWPFL